MYKKLIFCSNHRNVFAKRYVEIKLNIPCFIYPSKLSIIYSIMYVIIQDKIYNRIVYIHRNTSIYMNKQISPNEIYTRLPRKYLMNVIIHDCYNQPIRSFPAHHMNEMLRAENFSISCLAPLFTVSIFYIYTTLENRGKKTEHFQGVKKNSSISL